MIQINSYHSLQKMGLHSTILIIVANFKIFASWRVFTDLFVQDGSIKGKFLMSARATQWTMLQHAEFP